MLSFFRKRINSQATIQFDLSLTYELTSIVSELGLNSDFDVGEDGIEQISFAVI